MEPIPIARNSWNIIHDTPFITKTTRRSQDRSKDRAGRIEETGGLQGEDVTVADAGRFLALQGREALRGVCRDAC